MFNGLSIWDSFQSFLSGLGLPGRDKMIETHWWVHELDRSQLEAAYRGDWIARKAVEIPAFDITRGWRTWVGDDEQVKALKETEKAFAIQRKIYNALVKARLYGGAAVVLGTDDGPMTSELNLDRVKKGSLKFVHIVDRFNIATGPIMRDITSPWFGEPSYYVRSNTITPPAIGGVAPLQPSSLGYEQGAQIYIHPSRIIRLVGAEFPDMETAPHPWGDSILQAVADAIKTAGVVNASIGAAISEMKFDIIKVEGLTNLLNNSATASKLTSRFAQANAAKSVINTLLIDKDKEEWERKELRLNGMDKVMQQYLFIVAGAVDVPSTRFLGREPSGQNATGESDFRNYYDRLQAEEEVKLEPSLNRLDEILIRHTFGTRPEEIHSEWNTLWQQSDLEKADINLKKSQAMQLDVNAGIINEEVLRRGRLNALIEDPFLYPGIEGAIDEFGEEPEEEDIDEEEVMRQARQIQGRSQTLLGNSAGGKAGAPAQGGSNSAATS